MTAVRRLNIVFAAVRKIVKANIRAVIERARRRRKPVLAVIEKHCFDGRINRFFVQYRSFYLFPYILA